MNSSNIEIKINKEIRDFTENIYFGFSLRQCIFIVLAGAVGVAIFLPLKPILGTEITSWICIFAVIPFALFGFVKPHSLTLEQFLLAYLKSEWLTPRKLPFITYNYYYEILMINKKLEKIGNKKGKKDVKNK